MTNPGIEITNHLITYSLETLTKQNNFLSDSAPKIIEGSL